MWKEIEVLVSVPTLEDGHTTRCKRVGGDYSPARTGGQMTSAFPPIERDHRPVIESYKRERRIVALVLAFTLTACAGSPETRVNSDELLAAIEAGTAPTILDVRSRAEYNAGHVPGAIHFPFYNAWTRAAEIPSGKADEVVLYCEHGPRAWLARFGLTSAGFERVRLLTGHMMRWRSAGHPVAKGPR